MIITLFWFMYYYMPNTRVKWQAALVGALFGGTVWVNGRRDLCARRGLRHADGGDVRRLRDRAAVPGLAAPELARDAARRAALVLRAAPRAPAHRARADPDHGDPARAHRDGRDVPDRAAVPRGRRALEGLRPRGPHGRAGVGARQRALQPRGPRTRADRGGRHRRAGARPRDDHARRHPRCDPARDAEPAPTRSRTACRRPTRRRSRPTPRCARACRRRRCATWSSATRKMGTLRILCLADAIDENLECPVFQSAHDGSETARRSSTDVARWRRFAPQPSHATAVCFA